MAGAGAAASGWCAAWDGGGVSCGALPSGARAGGAADAGSFASTRGGGAFACKDADVLLSAAGGGPEGNRTAENGGFPPANVAERTRGAPLAVPSGVCDVGTTGGAAAM